jgi:hypothetical protein
LPVWAEGKNENFGDFSLNAEIKWKQESEDPRPQLWVAGTVNFFFSDILVLNLSGL